MHWQHAALRCRKYKQDQANKRIRKISLTVTEGSKGTLYPLCFLLLTFSPCHTQIWVAKWAEKCTGMIWMMIVIILTIEALLNNWIWYHSTGGLNYLSNRYSIANSQCVMCCRISALVGFSPKAETGLRFTGSYEHAPQRAQVPSQASKNGGCTSSCTFEPMSVHSPPWWRFWPGVKETWQHTIH